MSDTITEPTTEPAEPTAREVLTQALDYLEQSFWIKRQDFSVPPSTAWDTVEKFIKVPASSDYYTNAKADAAGFHKLTGVCSVGAMAVARSVLRNTGLQSFGTFSMLGREMQWAAMVLAQAIYAGRPPRTQHLMEMQCCNYGRFIATWNDDYNTTREEVLATFAAALEHPLLDATEGFAIAMQHLNSLTKQPYSSPSANTGLVFLTEEAAQAAIAGPEDPSKPLVSYYGTPDLTRMIIHKITDRTIPMNFEQGALV